MSSETHGLSQKDTNRIGCLAHHYPSKITCREQHMGQLRRGLTGSGCLTHHYPSRNMSSGTHAQAQKEINRIGCLTHHYPSRSLSSGTHAHAQAQKEIGYLVDHYTSRNLSSGTHGLIQKEMKRITGSVDAYHHISISSIDLMMSITHLSDPDSILTDQSRLSPDVICMEYCSLAPHLLTHSLTQNTPTLVLDFFEFGPAPVTL